MKRGLTVWLIVLMALAVLSGCSSTSGSGAASSTQTPVGGSRPSNSAPGVSATQINVGAISSLSGPLAGIFGGLAPGMIAYFNTLNAAGGINGRKIVLTNNLDDGGSPSQFTQDVHTLIDQDHVFAAAASSAWFTPGYFVSTKTPTYGYNVSANWQNAPNLFAVGGSTQVYSAGFPQMALLHQEGGGQEGGLHQLRTVHRLLVQRLQRLRQGDAGQRVSTSTSWTWGPSWVVATPRTPSGCSRPAPSWSSPACRGRTT